MKKPLKIKAVAGRTLPLEGVPPKFERLPGGGRRCVTVVPAEPIEVPNTIYYRHALRFGDVELVKEVATPAPRRTAKEG